jgi:hypothetical protein
MCPPFQSVVTCDVADEAACQDGKAAIGCAPSALPIGGACAEGVQCGLTVFPCPASQGTVDGYICTCVDSRWSCQDCDPGSGECFGYVEAGPFDAAME